MNRYFFTQALSITAVLSATLWWYCFPDNGLHAGWYVEWMLGFLQAMILPNAFMSLLTAVLLLPSVQLKRLAGCFFQTMMMLWFVVSATLLSLWFILAEASVKSALPTFTVDKVWLVILVPVIMIAAVLLGVCIVLTPRLSFLIPRIRLLQERVSMLFECVFVLIPMLVFFVVLKFLTTASLDKTNFVIHYFLLAIIFVSIINVIIFPLLYRYVLGVKGRRYIALISPVVLMTFIAGDSIAAVPLIANAAENYGQKDPSISKIITMVVICFPWVGELANLVFPIYTAILEHYDFYSVLSMLSVGPFFMFTDPYISIPNLLGAFNFLEEYQITYMTIALLTDHMFEVCESIAVLFVVLRLKLSLPQKEPVQ